MSKSSKAVHVKRAQRFTCLVGERMDGEARERDNGGHSLSKREICGAESDPFSQTITTNSRSTYGAGGSNSRE